MRPLILISLIALTSCGPETRTEYVQVKTTIPPELLRPAPISDRKVSTVNELAALATEHLRSAEQANSQIAAIAEIVGPQ